MTQPLSFQEFQALAQHSKRIAVFREVPMDSLTAVQSYQALSQVYGDNGVIFENLCEQEIERYSYVCFEAIASLRMHPGDKRNPLAQLRNLQTEFSFATRDSVRSRINSALGFMAYDVVRYFENIPDSHLASQEIPVLLFQSYALGLTFDHAKQCILISKVVLIGDDLEEDYRGAQQKMDETVRLLKRLLSEDATLREEDAEPCKEVARGRQEVDISDPEFVDKIKTAKAHIVAGDAFQIVLSRCFKRPYSAQPLDIYKALCQVSPSPFMFYFPTEAAVIVGASPERMLSVIDGQVTVNPIAGTRKRGARAAFLDEAITADLLQDTKELAEHMMLIDLARNDVGAVSLPGTVVVSELLKVKHYSHVSHITSSVQGQLQEQYDAFDAFAKAFPAGTLSGAPKIRAMEIIDALETSRRGIYGGAICRIDALGNFDSCIAIRMAILQEGIASIRVGAGIVYDSNPASEAAETQQKAQPMLDAIAMAEKEVPSPHHPERVS